MKPEIVSYRPALEADIGSMALVMVRANELRDGHPLSERIENDAVLDDLRSRMDKTGAWTHVAVDRSNIAGFMLGYTYGGSNEGPVEETSEYLSLLMIDPDYWGKGIASRLLDIAADKARRVDRQQLLLWTRAEDNERARGVYEHKGYTNTGKTRISKNGFGLQVLYALDL